jgi:hypothetical protein
MSMVHGFDFPLAKTVHNVKNRQGCEYVGGAWDESEKVCMMNESGSVYIEAGWTAPIHGLYFWYEISDDSGWQEKPYLGVTGCLVKDSEDYPFSPGWCRAVYHREFDYKRDSGDKVINHFYEISRDAMDLKLKKHGLALIEPPDEWIQGLPDRPFIGYPGIIKDFKRERGRDKIVPFHAKIGGEI